MSQEEWNKAHTTAIRLAVSLSADEYLRERTEA